MRKVGNPAGGEAVDETIIEPAEEFVGKGAHPCLDGELMGDKNRGDARDMESISVIGNDEIGPAEADKLPEPAVFGLDAGQDFGDRGEYPE